jgi:hypothetical protein
VTTTVRVIRLAAAHAVLAALPLLPAPAAPQLASQSAAALGMADAHTAAARDYAAASWNPATLALPGTLSSTLLLFPLRVEAGIGPVGLADFAAVQGEQVDAATRRGWLERIQEEGGQTGTAQMTASAVAGNVGRVGFQLSHTITTRLDFAPEGAELLLFGNVGAGDTPRELGLTGSSVDIAATSTFALAYARPVQVAGQSVAVGVTGKYTFGNLLYTGEDRGSHVTVAPTEVRIAFPIIQADTAEISGVGDYFQRRGGGIAMDLGVAWQTGRWTAGARVRNLFDTYSWHRDRLYFRPGEALFTEAGSGSDFEPRSLSEAPAAIAARADLVRYGRSLGVGVAFAAAPWATLAADFHATEQAVLEVAPPVRFATGAELWPLRWLPLRAGASFSEHGTALSGGAALSLGSLYLGAGILHNVSGASERSTIVFNFGSVPGR